MIIQLEPMTISWGNQSETYHGIYFDVDSFYQGWARFESSEWAPGVWVGTEGMRIYMDGNPYKVIEVDLEDRKVKLEAI